MSVAVNLGPYAGFIVAAYAAAVVVVGGLVLWVVLDRRHLIRMIEDIEARGITRRSEGSREGNL
jgi:heme exporter protein D